MKLKLEKDICFFRWRKTAELLRKRDANCCLFHFLYHLCNSWLGSFVRHYSLECFHLLTLPTHPQYSKSFFFFTLHKVRTGDLDLPATDFMASILCCCFPFLSGPLSSSLLCSLNRMFLKAYPCDLIFLTLFPGMTHCITVAAVHL